MGIHHGRCVMKVHAQWMELELESSNYWCLILFLKVEITLKVVKGIYNGVKTTELDTLAAEIAASMTTKHPDYALLAARIEVSNLHKETKKVFSGKHQNTSFWTDLDEVHLVAFLFLTRIWKCEEIPS